MKSRILVLAILVLLVAGSSSWSFFKPSAAGVDMTTAAEQFVGSLDDKQKEVALLAYDTPDRVKWHFIPLATRKGLQVKEMTEEQKALAHKLLKSSLSELGYGKATKIMQLETLLNHLEMGKGPNIRDPYRYYFTLFGKPGLEGRWGLSIEGHHLSFNFVVDGGKIISSTPQFMASNPAEVKDDYIADIKKCTRILGKEEELAFALVTSLNEEQSQAAIIDATAPKEIRGAGEPQPSQDTAVGLTFDKLNEEQQKTLRNLMAEYLRAMPTEVSAQRLVEIEEAGVAKIYFAWAGATKPGIGHYYRVQGPTFLIEFVNTQPDAAGNPANHIHCVWRDMRGDFALPIGG
jgi:hypothetical protein